MKDNDSPIQGYKGKEPHYARPSYDGKHLSMQVQATQGRFKQHWKGTISQSKAIHEFYYLKLPRMATKEKHLIMLGQAIMVNTFLCKSKLLKEEYYCSIQAIMKWCVLIESSYHASILS
ncbi:hypothetical protein H5410_005114 [Solanum commersonii]|uniref:Uncharacterized protein n=1 Tax=Solanum commersonii TaxID=4109 RepID=A0A9J6A695_SOLCO|nr:hypothetical protein H5410_005114 [Solanum commersonii]